MVGVLPRPMSRARQPPMPPASRKPEPGQRLGLVAAQLAVEALGRAWPVRRDTSAAAASRSAAQPPPSTVMPPASGVPSRPSARRSMSAPVSWVVSARSAERVGRGAQVGLVERDPLATRADERPGLLGQRADLGRGELDVVEHRRPAHVGELVGADRGLLRLREQPQRSAWPCGWTARGRARRSRRRPGAGR